MSDEPQQPPPDQDSDYDGAWKEALRNHFREVLEKYFPAAAIDRLDDALAQGLDGTIQTGT